jgi:predicted dinucleotide-binding enzyme
MRKKIGIIGSGIVGVTLANGFLKHGYAVTLGTNTPGKREELKKKTAVAVGSFAEAAEFGETIVLAVKGSGAEAALRAAGIERFKGKTIIDTTNPIASAPPVNGVIQYFTSLSDSLMERLQTMVPEGRFVKAFSSIGNALMVNPDFGGIRPSMFICGNHENGRGCPGD